jgi:DNA-binding IclR family transcriptional regulator
MNANDEELQELFDDYDFKIYTPTTLKNLKEYKSDLQEARRRGYALDCAEHIEGVHCAAAPVYDHKGQTIASITVTGPSFRMSEETLAEAGTMVRQEALKASTKMGFEHITEEAVS